MQSLSVCSVRQILHSNSKFHLHILMVPQELLKRDYETCEACCKDILENVPVNTVLPISDEAHFHLPGFDN